LDTDYAPSAPIYKQARFAKTSEAKYGIQYMKFGPGEKPHYKPNQNCDYEGQPNGVRQLVLSIVRELGLLKENMKRQDMDKVRTRVCIPL
jgi:hypothetical protein